MAKTEGSGSAAGDSAAEPAPEEVRRATALPAVSGEPGEALTPNAPGSPGSATATRGQVGEISEVSEVSQAQSSAEATASGAGAPEDSARAAAEGDRRGPEGAGLAAVGTTASGPDNGDGDGTAGAGSDAGRPKKPFLAAAAIAGTVLVAVPLLVLGTVGGDDDDPSKKTVANADTLLSDRDTEAPPADYLPAETPSPTPTRTPEKTATTSAPPPPPATSAPPPATSTPATNRPARQEDSGKQQEVRKDPPKTPSIAKNSLVSADTGKCMTVDQVTDGAQVFVWDCDSNREQQWVFQQNGTVRMGGLCLDIGAASTATEAKVQVAYCNGNVAQQFRLQSNGALVAVISNYCLDVWQGRQNGTTVTTWHCNSQPNQRWRHV